MQVRLFQPLLAAQTPDDLDAFVQGLRYPVLASPKLDGVRAFVRGGALLSRKLKPIPNELLQRFLPLPEHEGLDGELVAGPPTHKAVFQRSMSAVMRRDAGFDELPLTFYVFDRHDSDLPFAQRLKGLEQGLGKKARLAAPGVAVQVLKHVLVKDAAELLHLEAELLELGFEGVMLRDPAGPYKQGRSTVREGTLLKLKRFEYDEAQVLEAYEQEANLNEATKDERGYTKRSSHKANRQGKGTLGGYRVRMLTGDFKGQEVDVGTGWEDAERAELWAEWLATPRQAQRRVMRVKHQLSGAKDKPRFPVFAGWL